MRVDLPVDETSIVAATTPDEQRTSAVDGAPTTVHHQMTDHLGPLAECPRCGATRFEVRETAGAVVFECADCHTGWRFELGFVWPVDIGCPEPT